jgi:hypothetical protein
MAEWKFNKDETIKELDADFDNIQNLFLSGKVSKLYQLVERSPTKIAVLLGLNYGSYIDKLQNPERFSTLHINTIAFAIKIDPNIIHDIIQSEIHEKVEAKINKFENRNKK